MEICLDFDGSCVTHEFPKIGKDIGAIPVLKALVGAGHKIILFTMRSDVEEPKSYDKEIIERAGMYLSDAILWFYENEIELYGVQCNPSQKTWTTSPKAYGQLYIDDAALGAPLINNPEICNRPYLDWVKVRQELVRLKILP